MKSINGCGSKRSHAEAFEQAGGELGPESTSETYRHASDQRQLCDYGSSPSLSPFSKTPATTGYSHLPDLKSFTAPKKPFSTLEDKRRGKRLFGGLLSTLKQASDGPRQQRHKHTSVSIEESKAYYNPRQRKLSELHEVRMYEQVEFEDRVMRNKHGKSLWVAKHLKTDSEPHIYYLPSKLLRHQRRTIDKQTSDAETNAARDCNKAFLARQVERERHWPSHRRLSPPPLEEMVLPATKEAEASDCHPRPEASDHGRSRVSWEQPSSNDVNGVVVETEDTVMF